MNIANCKAEVMHQTTLLNLLARYCPEGLAGWNIIQGNLCLDYRGLNKDIINRTFTGNSVPVATMKLYSCIEQDRLGTVVMELEHPKFSGTVMVTVDMVAGSCYIEKLRRSTWEYMRGYFHDQANVPSLDPLIHFFNHHPGDYQVDDLSQVRALPSWVQMNPAKNAFRQYAEATIVDRDLGLSQEKISERRELSSGFIEKRHGERGLTIQQMDRRTRQLKMHAAMLRIMRFDLQQIGDFANAECCQRLSNILEQRAEKRLSEDPLPVSNHHAWTTHRRHGFQYAKLQ